MDIWDVLFAFLSGVMQVFEVNPQQVADTFAHVLLPDNEVLADKVTNFLLYYHFINTIISKKQNINCSLFNYVM